MWGPRSQTVCSVVTALAEGTACAPSSFRTAFVPSVRSVSSPLLPLSRFTCYSSWVLQDRPRRFHLLFERIIRLEVALRDWSVYGIREDCVFE